jgi:hypothetical protein
MPLLWALLLATPQTCTMIEQPCRACTTIDGKRQCSNVGIACQPKVRICRPKGDMGGPARQQTLRKGNARGADSGRNNADDLPP